MKKTHWKKLDNPNYLGAYSLLDGETTEINATIEKVVTETVKSERGDDDCRVAYLKGMKPMILNTTNSKVIESIANSPYIEDWQGLTITIYVDNILFRGEKMDALRVKRYYKKPEPTKKQVEDMKKLKGEYTITDFKKKYTLSDKQIKEIENA